MKKYLVIFLATLIVFSLGTTVVAAEAFTEIDVPQCTTAPEIDGTISSGEYKYITSFDKNDSAWNRDTRGLEEYDVSLDLYATWDDTYFYYAVRVKNIEPDYTPGPNLYVFEQPSIMTAMVYDDPTLSTFASSDGKDWNWSDAAAASFSREWTIGTTKDDEDFTTVEGYSGCNHFGLVRDDENFKFAVSHGDYDVYEQAIPWAAIAKTEGIEVGGKCGFAFTCCVKSVTEDYEGGYISFASGIDGGKSFDRYALVNLTANEPFEEFETDTSADESESGTVPTGDNLAFFAIIAVLAIVGAGVVVSKVRR